MTATKKLFLSYIGRTLAGVIVVLGAVMLVNLLVDPLWYFEGSPLSRRNFPFDERTSKSVRLLETPGAYDCIIFGGSRITLLNESHIAGHKCFNYSFSSGYIDEFIAFAEYARFLGVRPGLVIVELNGETFATGPIAEARNTRPPAFIRDKKYPPPFWINYVSADALRFSLRRLFNRIGGPRYYDQELRGQASKGVLEFRPEERKDRVSVITGYSPDNIPLYTRLRAIFPEARFVGLVLYINAWEIADMDSAGLLPGYLATMHQASHEFEIFYDFGIPSPVTRDISLTYDGIHYYSEAFDRVTRILSSNSPLATPEIGLRVDQISLEEYLEAYEKAGSQPPG